MAQLSDGEHMLSNVQWKRQDRESGLRPLRGFTTGTLSVNGSRVTLEARFNDQNLSNRFSDLEQDGVSITIQATLLGTNEVFLVSMNAPTLERAGACYVLRARGKASTASAVHPA